MGHNEQIAELQRQVEFWTRKADSHTAAGEFQLADAVLNIAELRYKQLEAMKSACPGYKIVSK